MDESEGPPSPGDGSARLERALRECEQRFDALVNGACDGVFMVDPDGRFLFVNDFIAQSSGYPKEAFVGRHFLELIREEDHELVTRNFERALAGERPPPYELAYYTASGEQMWVEISTTRVVVDGQNTGVLSISRNIQARKRVEEELRESEAKYRALIEGLPHGVAIVQDQRVVFANDAANRMVGSDMVERGEAIETFTGAWQRDRIAELHRRRVAGDPGLPRHYRTTLLRSDRSELPVEIHVQPIQYGGRDAWQCVAIDLSESAALEAQLQHSQKMEAVGTMAGGIAHDFNNLLAGILGTAEMLKRRPRTPEEVQDSAEVIEQAALRAADLTRQLLGFARKADVVRVPVDVEGMVDEVCRMLARTLDKRIRVSRRILEEGHRTLGDATQIGQVLMNLALNARDAMPEGGELTFEVDSVTVDDPGLLQSFGITPGSYCRVTVSDTGTGIDPEIRDRIFDPFFTTKPVGKGSGMGLAVAYGIVRSHHGAIEVHSAPGEGARLSVLLPPALDRHATTSAPPPLERSASAEGRGIVLLVDDEPLLRTTTTRLLESMGYAVLPCPDAPAAIEALGRQRREVTVALIDVSMPGMDGWACLAGLREIAPRLPVVMTSGRPPAAEQEARHQSTAFLPKPYGYEQLAAALENALDGE